MKGFHLSYVNGDKKKFSFIIIVITKNKFIPPMSTPNFASAVSFEDDMVLMLLRDTLHVKCWKNVNLTITDYE